jgi:hypothetical protein
MAHIVVTTNEGLETSYVLSPAIEYAFESEFGEGIYKRFREKERQSDAYWLAWECLRQTNPAGGVKPFSLDFVKTLKRVDIDFNEDVGKE